MIVLATIRSNAKPIKPEPAEPRREGCADLAFDLPVSQASAVKAGQWAQHLLLPTVQVIGQACAASAVLHADKQGQAWAGDMIELLSHASHIHNVHCADGQVPNDEGPKYQSQVRDLRHLG